MSDVFFHLRARGLSRSLAVSSDMEARPSSLSFCVRLSTWRRRSAQVEQPKASDVWKWTNSTSMSRNIHLERKKAIGGQTRWIIEMYRKSLGKNLAIYCDTLSGNTCIDLKIHLNISTGSVLIFYNNFQKMLSLPNILAT